MLIFYYMYCLDMSHFKNLADHWRKIRVLHGKIEIGETKWQAMGCGPPPYHYHRLTVVDHNHPLGRQQARTKAGKTKFTKKFSKQKKIDDIAIVKEAKNIFIFRICVLKWVIADKLIWQNSSLLFL